MAYIRIFIARQYVKTSALTHRVLAMIRRLTWEAAHQRDESSALRLVESTTQVACAVRSSQECLPPTTRKSTHIWRLHGEGADPHTFRVTIYTHPYPVCLSGLPLSVVFCSDVTEMLYLGCWRCSHSAPCSLESFSIVASMVGLCPRFCSWPGWARWSTAR